MRRYERPAPKAMLKATTTNAPSTRAEEMEVNQINAEELMQQSCTPCMRIWESQSSLIHVPKASKTGLPGDEGKLTRMPETKL